MSARKNISVFGIYPDQLTAEDGIEALKEAGFRNTDISALFPDNNGTKDFGHEKHTKAPEGAVAGGATGAIIGGALGWLAGIGSLAIPGIGPFVAAGPIMAMLGGIGVVGALGGLTGGLVGIGIPEYEAKRYEGRIRHGGILISVHCDEEHWARAAKDILSNTGAEEIATSHEAKGDYSDGKPGRVWHRHEPELASAGERRVERTEARGDAHLDTVRRD